MEFSHIPNPAMPSIHRYRRFLLLLAPLHLVHVCPCCHEAGPGYQGRGPGSTEVWRCRRCWVKLYSKGLGPHPGVLALGPSHFERKALDAAGLPWQEAT